MSSPQEIYEQVLSDLLKAEAKVAEMQSEIMRIRKRIKDANKLLAFMEKTYDIKRPKETIQIPTNGKPEGIMVIDPDLECPVCHYQAGSPQGLARHGTTHGARDLKELRSMRDIT